MMNQLASFRSFFIKQAPRKVNSASQTRHASSFFATSFLRSHLPTGNFKFQKPAPPFFKSSSYRTYATYKTFSNVKHYPNIYDQSFQQKILLVIGGFGIFYVINLKEAPITRRKRFLWVSKWMENTIGYMTYRSIMAQYGNALLPKNHPVQREVENVVRRLIKSSEKIISANDNNIGDGSFSRDGHTNEIKWEVHVVNDPRAPPNAFVVPGGKIFVFSSIFNISQNEDGLAMVLSHEISHQLARHVSEQLSRRPFGVVAELAAYAVFGSSHIIRNVTALFELSHSRVQESEADYIGLMVMANACFHPEEGAKIWKRFAEYGKRMSKAPEYLSSHPSDETRIENMRKWLPEASARRGEAGCDDVTAFFKYPW